MSSSEPSQQSPPGADEGTITVRARHTPLPEVRCYTIWDHQLDQLEALPAAGIQAVASLTASVSIGAIGIITSGTELIPAKIAAWHGTAWGTGIMAFVLWLWWAKAVWTRRKVVRVIRSAEAKQDVPPT